MIEFSKVYQALKTLSPFIPRSSVEGKIQGVLFDPGTLALSAIGFSSSGFFFLEEALSERRFVIPSFVVDSLLKLPSESKWEGIKFVSPTQVVIDVGGLSLKFPVLAADSVSFPELKGESCKITKSFIANLARNAVFMNDDDRKVNLYGMFCGDGGIYACDNIRLVFSAEDIDPKMCKTFLPFPCVEKLAGNENISVFQKSENLLVFATENSIFCFSSLDAKFPEVAEHLKKVIDSENPIIVVDNEQPSLAVFEGMFTGGKKSVPLSISADGSVLHLDASSYDTDFQISCDLPITSQSVQFEKFRIKAKLFLESLLLFKHIKIGPDWVLLYDGKSVHMVMKMAE